MSIRFTVPGDPVPKARPRFFKDPLGPSGVFTPASTRAYETMVKRYAAIAMRGRDPLNEPLHMEIIAARKIPASWSARKREDALLGKIMACKKPDLDNFIKAALDGCQGVVYRDDAQVVGIQATKMYSSTPCLRIVASSLHLLRLSRFPAEKETA